jgi:hypothetical protein
MYCAAVVTQEDHVLQIPCVYSDKYICGNDTNFWDVNKPEHIQDFLSGDLHVASIAPMVVPACYDTNLPFIDRTGRFGNHINVSAELEERLALPFARFYNEKWNLEGDNQTTLLASIRQPSRCNTRCFRGHQLTYNHATKMFDVWTQNKGPWGPRVYPGCGKVRSGYDMHFEIPKYKGTKTYGLDNQ